MNDKNIFDALRDIDEQWILDAAPGKRKSVASTWVKWGTLAACLCLVVASVLAIVLWSQSHNGASPFHTHIFGEWEVTKEASCSERGEQMRVCACGEKEMQLIALLPHFAGEWVIEKEPTIKMPTADDPNQREPGIKCQFCDRCGAKLGEELIPATGSLGLAYAINPDGKTFAVAGIGNCTDKHIVVPENFCGYHVTSVMWEAFRDCQNVQSITLPETVTLIDNYAFQGSGITSVILPNVPIVIGVGAFSNSAIRKIVIPTNATVKWNAFEGCEKLTSVTFLAGTKEIAENTFAGCWRMKTLILPDGLEKIGNKAFLDCAQLTEIRLPSTVTSIGKEAFAHCSSIASINLPNGLRKIAEGTFAHCYRLEDVVIPDSVLTIDGSAFAECYRLKSIVIPDSVVKIGEGSFQNCTALERVVLPKYLATIEKETFLGCEVLEELVIPENVQRICENAFEFCNALIEVEGGVCYVGNWAVDYDRQMENVTVRQGTVCLADRLFYKYGTVTSVTLPQSVQYIGAYAFAENSNLKSIVFCGTAAQWDAIVKGENWNWYSNWYSVIFKPEESPT
jgi:hypothetical protein